MSLERGDILLAVLPFVTRPGSKLRPVLVVQNDQNNTRMQNTIVAAITTRISRSAEPTQVLIDVTTPEGRQSGLIATSVVSCENLITIRQSQGRWIGRLSPSTMSQVDAALKQSLGL
jgi:mRNA interferase MazF